MIPRKDRSATHSGVDRIAIPDDHHGDAVMFVIRLDQTHVEIRLIGLHDAIAGDESTAQRNTSRSTYQFTRRERLSNLIIQGRQLDLDL